jgi:hypothetical protein
LHYDPLLGRLVWTRVQNEIGTQNGGFLLEVLIGYLFWTSGEYDVRRSTRGLDAEVDLRVRTTFPAKPPHHDLGGYLLIECKNTNGKTAPAAVKKFATDVRLAGCRCGVLVSVRGVTGATGGRGGGASYTVRKLYHADGTVIVVFDGQRINDIVEQRIALADALRAGYEAIRFDYPS